MPLHLNRCETRDMVMKIEPADPPTHGRRGSRDELNLNSQRPYEGGAPGPLSRAGVLALSYTTYAYIFICPLILSPNTILAGNIA